MRVPEVDGNEPGGEIEIAPAAIVVEVRALAAHDYRRLAPALRDPRREHVTLVHADASSTRGFERFIARASSVDTTIRPPATLSAKNTMKIQTPKRFQKFAPSARRSRVVRRPAPLHEPCALRSLARCAVRPQPFQVVERALLGRKDVHDHVAQIDENPGSVGVAFDARDAVAVAPRPLR